MWVPIIGLVIVFNLHLYIDTSKTFSRDSFQSPTLEPLISLCIHILKNLNTRTSYNNWPHPSPIIPILLIQMARNCLSLTHLLFADECFFFSWGKQGKGLLVGYYPQCLFHSLRPKNLLRNVRDHIQVLDTPTNTKNQIASILKMKLWDSPEKYLGLPTD